MMHVYVTIKALESMALMTRWNKILSCREVYEIYIDATEDTLSQFSNNYEEDFSYDDCSDVSPISQLIRDGIIRPNAAKQKIEEIKDNPLKVLEDPSAVYFLDVTSEEAADIQKQYGVICKNENEIDDTELGDWGEIISSEGDLDHSWSEFLAKIKQEPTNSILISDRFVFSNDELANDRKSNGIDNIISIIDAILPKSFTQDSQYHVFILDSDKNPKGESNCKIAFNKLAKKLSEKISDLRKGKYKILVEVVAVPGNSYGYEWTHNRRVMTNYHIIRTEHNLKAFCSDKSICSQTLNWDSLFSKGIMDKNDISYKNFKILLNNIQKINTFGKANPERSMYKYACDGICPKSSTEKDRIIFSDIRNRMVNYTSI